jgi:hypothetical protein
MTTVKSLENTFIYRMLNGNNSVSNGVMGALKEGTILKKENLEEAFMIINKNFKFPLKYKVLEEFERGDIVLVYSPDKVRIPTAMPFFLTRNAHNKVVAVVIVDTYGKMNPETKNVNIDAKKLYTMMEAALMAKTYFHHSHEIAKRNVVITSGSSIYSNMFVRVLNKKYALNADKSKFHKVIFLASKFFMINVLGLADNEMTANYAIRNCVGGNPYTLRELNDAFETENFKDISTFLQALAKPEYGLNLKDLTVRGYLEQFINMYDQSALLSLEYFPYFAYNIISVTNGAYINNQYILEDIVEKHGPKIYTDIASVSR